MLNPVTGLWEDDEHPDAGSLGEQAGAPTPPVSPPPAAQAPGPEAPSPEPQGPPVVKIDEPFNISAGPEPGAAPAPVPGGAPDVLPAPLPQVAPYSPTLPPPVPAGRVVSPAEAANLSATDANTAAATATAKDKGALGMAAAGAKSEDADRQAQIAAQHAADLKQIDDKYTKRIEDRQAQANAAYQQAFSAGIHDPEADKSFGRKLLEGIAVAMGAYSSAVNGGPNQALSIIQNATKENIERQKAEIEKKFRMAEHLGKDAESARQERDDALNMANMKESAQNAFVAAMLRQNLAKIGIPQAQIDANTDVQKLETDALKQREDVLKSIRGDETTLAKADIAAAAKRARAASGGGAGGLAKESQLAQYLQQNPGDMAGAYAVGAKLGMNRKAVDDVFAREKEQSTGARAEADKFASENGLNAIAKQQRELAELSKALKDNQGNPLQQALAVEKAVSAARGGAASKQALALALGHLGGSLDSAEGFIQKIKDGQLGPKQLENFEAFLNGQRGAAQAAGKEAYDNYTRMIDDATDPGTKARLIRERSRLFSGMDGYGKSEAPKPAQAAGGGKQAAAPLKIETTMDQALAARAKATKPGDPLYPSAQKWLRAHGM